MLDFSDPKVLALTRRTEIIPDQTVPTFSCNIVLDLADGQKRENDVRTAPSDLNFSREELKSMLKRIVSEVEIGPEAIDTLDDYVFSLERRRDLSPVLDLFAIGRSAPQLRVAER
jgi:hypothetical protein